jgi:transposase InsO family protein
MRFRFVQAEKATYPVSVMCRVLEVSRSGFYAWVRRPESARSRDDRTLLVAIRAAHQASRKTYGSPRIFRELQEDGHTAGRHRVARLMRGHDIRGRRRRRFRNTTQSGHAHPIAANTLDRCFTAPSPDAMWVTDITYIWTLEGWLYLSVILDLYSRRVVGWAMGSRIDQALTLRALRMAVQGRRPKPGLLHHSDRGSQYAAAAYRRMLGANGITCSMSRKGNCWDNAVAESFFATLKVELVHETVFPTRARAQRELFEYIEVFYNRVRRHSSLGYISPMDYENRRRPSLQEAA